LGTSLAASSALALSLGSAGNYAAVALNGQQKFTISSGGTVVNGDIYVGNNPSGNPDLDFSGGGAINGSIYADPNSTINISGGSAASGGTIVLGSTQSNQVSTDVAHFLSGASVLSADQTLGAVSGNTTIIATGSGVTVIDATSFNLQGGSKLTLSGTAGDTFIIRVSGNLTTGGNSNIVLDGLAASNVVFVVAGDVTMSGGTIDGTYLSSGGNVTLSSGIHNGAYIVAGNGKELKFQSAPTVNYVGFTGGAPVPEPSAAIIFGMGLCVASQLRRRAR
jgi:hypothetical protein